MYVHIYNLRNELSNLQKKKKMFLANMGKKDYGNKIENKYC